jgi:7,8-dihydroneopterin aldolase/epimerase/oxygenase
MGLIEIENMEFYAFHGHYREEQVIGNRFLVNVQVITPTDKAAKSDDLKDALNYQLIYETVKEQMQIKSHLLENVAGRILDRLYERFSTIEKATVKVSKMNPPMGGNIEKVSVTLSR